MTVVLTPNIIRVMGLTRQEWVDRLTFSQLLIIQKFKNPYWQRQGRANWFQKGGGTLTNPSTQIFIAMGLCLIITPRENLKGLALTADGKKLVELLKGKST